MSADFTLPDVSKPSLLQWNKSPLANTPKSEATGIAARFPGQGDERAQDRRATARIKEWQVDELKGWKNAL
jgi:hypothetical protein